MFDIYLHSMWGRSKKEVTSLRTEVANLKQQADLAAQFVENLSNGNFKDTYKEQGYQEDENHLMAALFKFRDKFDSLSKLERQQNWVNTGLAKFVEILRIENKTEEELYNQIITSLVKYLGANQGGLFVLDEEEALSMKACYAYDRKKFLDKSIKKGEGLLGQCVIEAETTMLTEVPDQYTFITSGLGHATPDVLLIVPLKTDHKVEGVLEIAGFVKFEPYQVAFVEKLAENIAAVIQQSRTSLEVKKLLYNSQQNEEMMRMQEEEMRQSMEELAATQEEIMRREDDTKHQLKSLRQEYEGKLLEIRTKEEELMKQKELLLKALSIDNILIDVAGRNRMLSQKICFLCELMVSGKFEYATSLKDTIELHDESLKVIKNGGLPPQVKTVYEFAVADAFLLPNIEAVDKAWAPFKEHALKIAALAHTEAIPTVKADLDYIEAQGLALLGLNNELVVKCIAFNEKKLLQSGLMKIV